MPRDDLEHLRIISARGAVSDACRVILVDVVLLYSIGGGAEWCLEVVTCNAGKWVLKG